MAQPEHLQLYPTICDWSCCGGITPYLDTICYPSLNFTPICVLEPTVKEKKILQIYKNGGSLDYPLKTLDNYKIPWWLHGIITILWWNSLIVANIHRFVSRKEEVEAILKSILKLLWTYNQVMFTLFLRLTNICRSNTLTLSFTCDMYIHR